MIHALSLKDILDEDIAAERPRSLAEQSADKLRELILLEKLPLAWHSMSAISRSFSASAERPCAMRSGSLRRRAWLNIATPADPAWRIRRWRRCRIG